MCLGLFLGSVSFYILCLFMATPMAYEVPRLGVQSELQLTTYVRATATPDWSQVCELHHSSWQHRIPNPLIKVRDGSCNLMVPSLISFHCATTGTPCILYSFLLICMPVFIPVPQCLVYCSFVILSEVWENYTSCSSFPPQDCFGNFASFMVPI